MNIQKTTLLFLVGMLSVIHTMQGAAEEAIEIPTKAVKPYHQPVAMPDKDFEHEVAMAFEQGILSEPIIIAPPSLWQRWLRNFGVPLALKLLVCKEYLSALLCSGKKNESKA